MSDLGNLQDFLEPVFLSKNIGKDGYKAGQIGKAIEVFEDSFPDFFEKDIILVGCSEVRGAGSTHDGRNAPNAIREEFYKLFYWHTDVKMADAGNIKSGATLNDTYAALKTVIKELTNYGKTVVVLGGSHDLTLAQYNNYVDKKKIIEAVCVDGLINLDIESQHRSDNFLMEMLTGEPNYIRHYNHIGFQSYYVHPLMLETMDKLRFDCFRLGSVKENLEEMEPVIRNCSLFSFDISAIAHASAPSNRFSPNGFNGEEACALMRFAGLSPNVNTVGIYGYLPEKDTYQLTAKQISHMLWYLIDGKSRGQREASLDEKDSFVEYHTAFAEVETVFLKSRKTNRWWMQLPDKKYIACSYKDYMLASSNEIPERWMRAQERV
ncbi:MAG TPA: formimidoylglutamase [Puia sp.]|jgi:formiminoglutamase|nr:formimidoylglutamase [Puia sp.]